ncbi:MAG TPA: hypothetical protein VIJ50_12275 [Solirubrobacteraceae bacterium]
MVGITRYHPSEVRVYEKHRHDSSRPRRRGSGHRRSRCRHRRRRRGAEFHYEHDDPVHKQYSEHPLGDNAVHHYHDAVNDGAQNADNTAGIQRSSVPEHG